MLTSSSSLRHRAWKATISSPIIVLASGLFAAAAAAATATAAAAAPPQPDHDPHFDLYVLAMSYQPEFCYEHRMAHYDGCTNPDEEWKGLTLHGMWPERVDGTWPASCTDEPFDPLVVDVVGPDRFEKHWPNAKAARLGDKGHFSFWEHEWTKHGTCSGLGQVDYFRTALDSYIETPAVVKLGYGATVPKHSLVQAYGGTDSVALICEGGGGYLAEVRVCLGKNPDGTSSGRISCIDSVIEQDNCNNEVFIAKFSPHTTS